LVSEFLKTTGGEILYARIDSLFARGLSIAHAHTEEMFEHPENYYTINYDRRDKYKSGAHTGSHPLQTGRDTRNCSRNANHSCRFSFSKKND